MKSTRRRTSTADQSSCPGTAKSSTGSKNCSGRSTPSCPCTTGTGPRTRQRSRTRTSAAGPPGHSTYSRATSWVTAGRAPPQPANHGSPRATTFPAPPTSGAPIRSTPSTTTPRTLHGRSPGPSRAHRPAPRRTRPSWSRAITPPCADYSKTCTTGCTGSSTWGASTHRFATRSCSCSTQTSTGCSRCGSCNPGTRNGSIRTSSTARRAATPG